MKNSLSKRLQLGDSRGGVLVMVAILLLVFIGVAALAIDIGYLSNTRNELQNVADSAALAGAGYLGNVYSGLPPVQHPTFTFNQSDIENVVKDVANDNKAAKQSISVISGDITVGVWDPSSQSVNPATLTAPDAVYVKARRDNVANTPISTFFAKIFNIDSLNVTAEAAAALSGPSVVAEGELKTPFGLSENVFPNNCTDLITFSPTTSSCAAWHNFFDPINSNAMADKLISLIQGDAACEHCGAGLMNGPDWLDANFDINSTPDSEVTPEAEAGDDFEFQGGTISSLFNGGYLGADYDGNTGTVYDNEKKPAPILALFDYYRYRDGDGDDTVWSATIPVYNDTEDSPNCMNPNTALEILGFAKIVVISPDPPPSSNIQVHVDCNMNLVDGRGGGGTFGNLKGTIPNLVK